MKDEIVKVGGKAIFRCKKLKSEVTYKWFVNGSPLEEGTARFKVKASKSHIQLVILNCSLGDAGTIKVTCSEGRSELTAKLTVTGEYTFILNNCYTNKLH